jgi:hypothetical protein
MAERNVDDAPTDLTHRHVLSLASLTTRLFTVSQSNRRWSDIIWWWEARRPAYNAILLIAGISSMIGIFVFLALPPTGFVKDPNSSPDDLGDPGLGFFVLVLFAVGANLCYTLGWIVELPLFWSNGDRPSIAPTLLKIGLAFSLIVMFLPTIGSFLYWVYRIVQ